MQDVEKRAIGKVIWRLIPFLIVCFSIGRYWLCQAAHEPKEGAEITVNFKSMSALDAGLVAAVPRLPVSSMQKIRARRSKPIGRDLRWA